MILMLRPLRVDEFVSAGSVSGTVVEITLFTTLMKTADGVFISVPNSQIWNSAITNYSRNPTRRLDIKVGIAYDDDVDAALEFMKNLVASDTRVLAEPAPMSFVANLGESSVDITARGWANTPDFWAAFWDLSRRSKTELEAAGFTIPFPQRDLHLKADSADALSAAMQAKAEAPKPAPRARATASKAKAKTAKPAASKTAEEGIGADADSEKTTGETKA